MSKTVKKIIIYVVGCLLIFGAGFGTSYIIDKINYARATNRIGSVLGDGYDKSQDLYKQLEQRLAETEQLQQQLNSVGSNIDVCIGLAQQSGNFIGQLRDSVDSVNSTTTNIGDTVRQLRENQQRIRTAVELLEEYNKQLEEQLGILQTGVGQ